MKPIFLLGILGAAIAVTSCSTQNKHYTIYPKSGANTQGYVDFSQKGKEVTMKLNVYNLKPGEHAIHIHEKGDCSATDGSSAGGHWNPAGAQHGKWETEHFHMGDIGNLKADASGSAQLEFKTDKWCIGCSDESKNIIGKAIIIHADKDDFHSQPTGNAGGRVACIEIK